MKPENIICSVKIEVENLEELKLARKESDKLLENLRKINPECKYTDEDEEKSKMGKRMNALHKEIDKLIQGEFDFIKVANPKEKIETYHRHFRWYSAELATYIKDKMLACYHLDNSRNSE